MAKMKSAAGAAKKQQKTVKKVKDAGSGTGAVPPKKAGKGKMSNG